jgi:hypothetical protein
MRPAGRLIDGLHAGQLDAVFGFPSAGETGAAKRTAKRPGKAWEKSALRIFMSV